jgi:amidase
VSGALGPFTKYFGLYLRLLMVMTSVRTPPEVRARRIAALRQLGRPLASAKAEGLGASASEYLLWQAEREQVRAAYRAFFRDWDVPLCPVFPTPAPPHSGRSWPPDPTRADTLDVDGTPIPGVFGLFYPAVATLPGQPATALPVGLSRGGLPLGMQAIGPYLEDRTPLRFAKLGAGVLGGFSPPPQFA